jgi:hypothetical protein
VKARPARWANSSLQVTPDLQDLAAYGISQPVIDLWSARFPNGLNDLQLAAVNDGRVLSGESLLVIAPTSAVSMKSGLFETLQHMVVRCVRAELRGKPLSV